MPFPKLRLPLALASLLGLLLAGCSKSATDDIHAAPRDTQPWENADLSGYDTNQLLAHLDTLVNATQAAAAADQAVEFHHLEVAMTPTLDALAANAPGNFAALATIETLKSLAVKLHLAGHDGNVAQGVKLGDAIANLVDRLKKELG
ncbi:hypothetical protein [Pelagicoccus mobilis]|uniref:Lipoprotein n=1 Tax=Pelagicoccus mobilis TaxID=415221 RepID=A0A934RW84_9BACT|nr:hypothetical protein [Pelagicoccus mobilis]MBK1878890.1 hypothetical protein [Pelagicoccus mobilis]